ncbi:LOW QUALITY PROTEIN: uncharacterized protein ACJ7VT_017475 [Polymixia lowei]
MAQQGIQMDRSKFCCSICLDILRDPVTIPCGHSYCMDCIKNCWDQEDQKGIHSCPQCRQTFIPRPAVFKSTMLAELVEELEKTGLQTAPLDHCCAGPGDVACDVCTGRKLKALKFCQVCLASYCEQHLQSHYDAAPLRKHKLVKASTEIQGNKCSRHDEVMKIFCRTDQQCICYLCAMDEHKGHDAISAAAERTERQKEFCVSQKNILERIKEKKDVKVLQQEVENINCSADKAVENSDRIFTELIRSIERRRSEVKEQIRTQQKAEVGRTEELQKQKEQQIAELRRRNTELEQLSHTEDHIHFLQKYPSLSCLSEYKDLPSTDIRPLQYFEDVAVAMSKTRDKVENILKQEVPEILLTVTEVDVLLSTPLESTTRDDYLKYSCQIKLDPNTAHVRLSLSEGNRKVTMMNEEQLYPRHPEIFIKPCQVLSTEGLTGRCYWEVEWSGGNVLIAVSYKNINRGGSYNECGFGNNDKSWALQCYSNRYEFKHNNITTPITGPQSSRVGVYLDYRAGTLCFYSVSETMTLLHRVQTTFTQPLYPGVGLGGCKMAQQGVQMDRSKFCCSICLDILRDPVTIPCGHSYCRDCIKNCWDQEDQRGIHSCPQCRQTFLPRPPVVKNTMLAELVEELEKTGLQAAPLDHCYAGPGDVACDVCTGRKLKALKFCQVCLVSYCEQHLQRHYDVAPLRKHKLVEASTEIQENICSRHDEVMKIFCRTDQQYICYLCAINEHKGHDAISAVTERAERQKELCVSQKNILERIQKEEKDVKVLQQEVENINCSADKAVENSDRIFTELIRSIERRRSEVKEQIRTQQKAEVSRTEELQKQKEQQIAELRRRNAELEQLSHTEDHIHFLQKYPSLSCLSEYKDLPSTDICPLQYFEDVAVAMSKTRDKVEDILKQEVPEILLTVTKVDVLLSTPPESTTRDDYLKYSRQIKLDPNTAHVNLSLSEGNRKVTLTPENQLYPHHPDRFINTHQVLSTEGLTGRCYWEVEWSGGNIWIGEAVSIAVSYKNINRGGDYSECTFGNNDKSWALQCSINSYEFKHNNIRTPIKVPRSSRVGVYLDYRAGTLCFYSVSETMTLLHRVQTTFTQPLYPGVGLGGWSGLGFGDTAELCLLK